MTHAEKINHLKIATLACGHNIDNRALDLIISLYELIIKKQGKTDIDSIIEVAAAVKERATFSC